LPPTELMTTGYWLALTEETVERLRNQGLWTSDPNDYGPNWPTQRDRARARDGYRCQNCGAPEQGRAHHVHHKIPFRGFASYRQANQLSNLVTLCSRCHRRAELAVRMRSGLAGLAFALGHLAPLFLMCDARDVGVHSDPQSPLADGQPAVVIYDQVPAGIGFSERLFELHDELMARAYELVAACECTDGCPSCVGPAGEDGLGGKRETLAIVEALSSDSKSRHET
jgi:DEAD/DEAH box helicase domain-containing protein